MLKKIAITRNEDKLEFLLRHNRQIRAIGFDDAPFVRHTTKAVAVAGVVCALTRFEGMLWGKIEADGWDSTKQLTQMLLASKFYPQLHLVLLDGIGMGGVELDRSTFVSSAVTITLCRCDEKISQAGENEGSNLSVTPSRKKITNFSQSGKNLFLSTLLLSSLWAECRTYSQNIATLNR